MVKSTTERPVIRETTFRRRPGMGDYTLLTVIPVPMRRASSLSRSFRRWRNTVQITSVFNPLTGKLDRYNVWIKQPIRGRGGIT